MDFELRPVHNKDGSVLLYDIYVGGVWQGSRRTAAQAHHQLRGTK